MSAEREDDGDDVCCCGHSRLFHTAKLGCFGSHKEGLVCACHEFLNQRLTFVPPIGCAERWVPVTVEGAYRAHHSSVEESGVFNLLTGESRSRFPA